MIVAIVGSRRFKRISLVRDYLDNLKRMYGVSITIISGGAQGVDGFAKFYSRKLGFVTLTINAKWIVNGVKNKNAGFERNSEIVEFIKSHGGEVHAFWNGKSKGTLDTIQKCDAAKIKVYVHDEEGNVC